MKKVASKIELGHKQLPKKVIIITGNSNTVVLQVKWYKRDLVF